METDFWGEQEARDLLGPFQDKQQQKQALWVLSSAGPRGAHLFHLVDSEKDELELMSWFFSIFLKIFFFNM